MKVGDVDWLRVLENTVCVFSLLFAKNERLAKIFK